LASCSLGYRLRSDTCRCIKLCQDAQLLTLLFISVCMLARLKTLRPCKRGLILSSGKSFSLSGWHSSPPSFRPTEYPGPSIKVKSARIWSWQYISNLCPSQECVERYLHCMLWKTMDYIGQTRVKIKSSNSLFGEHDEWQMLLKSIECLNMSLDSGICLLHLVCVSVTYKLRIKQSYLKLRKISDSHSGNTRFFSPKVGNTCDHGSCYMYQQLLY
jgi:hypothetical protein